MSANWQSLLNKEQQKPYFSKIQQHINERKEVGVTVFPPTEQMFSAFEITPWSHLKVVIIGQDPYHGDRQANGLAFSVAKGIKLPPSLRNIYKEIQSDIGVSCAEHGDLTQWAKQGVLLLNTVLSVEKGLAHSHKTIGWETFTDEVIRFIDHNHPHLVFLLWGSHAQKKASLINLEKHTVLNSVHPSPLSAHRGFFGCKHFSKANQSLIKHSQTPIDWVIR